ncbi:RNA-directed DNA polymerase, eukaryota, partial [Tanacetum coccineum]
QLEEFGESIGLIWEGRHKAAGNDVAIREPGEERAGIGIVKVGKIDWIRELCIKEKHLVVGIQETKSSYIDMKMVNNLWGSDDVDYVKEDAAVLGRWRGVNDMVGFVNVYGPRNESDRKTLWCRISAVIGNVNACWCIFGDFNEVRRLDERMNTDFSTMGALEFNDFIRRANLTDVPLGGKRYTRISDDGDRFLVSEEFQRVWRSIGSVALDRKLSDHCPIVLLDKGIDFGPKPLTIL